MTEEFAFKERIGKRGAAIYGDEILSSVSEKWIALATSSLPCTTFSYKQSCCVAVRYFSMSTNIFCIDAGFADDIVKTVFF